MGILTEVAVVKEVTTLSSTGILKIPQLAPLDPLDYGELLGLKNS